MGDEHRLLAHIRQWGWNFRIRPARVHYLLALWGLKSRLASGRQSSQLQSLIGFARSGRQSSQLQSLIGFARTRRCLLLVSNQTLLAGKGVILLLVVNLKI